MIISKTDLSKDLEYLYSERLILVSPEIFQMEIVAEAAIVDGGLIEGMVLVLCNEEFKIHVTINKDLCHITPATLLDVKLDLYEPI